MKTSDELISLGRKLKHVSIIKPACHYNVRPCSKVRGNMKDGGFSDGVWGGIL